MLRGFESARGVMSTNGETGGAHGVEDIGGCADYEFMSGDLVVFAFDL